MITDIAKNFRSILKNPIFLVSVILIPSLIFFIYISAFYNPISKLKNIPIGIIDNSHSKLSSEFISSLLTNNTYDFQIIGNSNQFYNKYYGYIIIPQNFSEDIHNFISPTIIVYSKYETNYLIYRTLSSFVKAMKFKLEAKIMKKAFNQSIKEGNKNLLNDYQISNSLKKIAFANKQLYDYFRIPFINKITYNEERASNFLNQKLHYFSRINPNFIDQPIHTKTRDSPINYGIFFITIFIVLTSFFGAIANSMFVLNQQTNTSLLSKYITSGIISLFQTFSFLLTSLIFFNMPRIFDFFILLFFVELIHQAFIYLIISLIGFVKPNVFYKSYLSDYGIKILYPILGGLSIFLLVSSGGIWPRLTLNKFYSSFALINPFYYMSAAFRSVLFTNQLSSTIIPLIIFSIILFIITIFSIYVHDSLNRE